MRKRLLYYFAAGLIAWSGITSFANADGGSETINSFNDDPPSDDSSESAGMSGNFDGNNIEIKVLDSLTSTDVYSVNMTWSAMQFTYIPASRIWNPEDLKWESNGSDGSWYLSDEAPTSAEDIESETYESVDPKIEVDIENRSSKALKVAFKAGEDNQLIDLTTAEQVNILNADSNDTGVTLEASGSETIPAPAQAEYTVAEGELYADADDIELNPEHYTITVGGSPKLESGEDTLQIPITVVFTPESES